MFILRRITSEGKESNQALGESYNTVWEHNKAKENEPWKEFDELLHPWPEPDQIFGFIIHNKGAMVQPLYKKSTYYVMCSDGKTFDKIKFQ